jgi:hypothetical protein
MIQNLKVDIKLVKTRASFIGPRGAQYSTTASTA